MKIINVIKTFMGTVDRMESFIIDDFLSKSNNQFFTEKEGIEKAKELFKLWIEENKIDMKGNNIELYYNEGYINNGNGLELSIYWSGININE